MDAEGDGLAQGLAEVAGALALRGLGEALLVEAVTGFVHGAVEGVGELFVAVAGGEAGVAGGEA